MPEQRRRRISRRRMHRPPTAPARSVSFEIKFPSPLPAPALIPAHYAPTQAPSAPTGKVALTDATGAVFALEFPLTEDVVKALGIAMLIGVVVIGGVWFLGQLGEE